MIEVCLSNNQRFFVHETEQQVLKAIADLPALTGYVTDLPGETSRVWFINPRHIVSFSDADA